MGEVSVIGFSILPESQIASLLLCRLGSQSIFDRQSRVWLVVARSLTPFFFSKNGD